MQCHAFSKLRTSSRECDEFFQAFLSNCRIAESAKIAARPINHHPDLPQVRFGMFDDPTRYFTQTTRSALLRRGKRLKTTCIVSLGLHPSPDLLKSLFKLVRVLRPGGVETSLPEGQTTIPNAPSPPNRKTRIASGKRLGVLSKQELCHPRAQLHLLDDR